MMFGLERWINYTNNFFHENLIFRCPHTDKDMKVGSCMSIEGDETGKVYIYLKEVEEE